MEVNPFYNKCFIGQLIPVMPVSPKLANAYVPYQYYESLYPPETGLKQGTIFPCLNRPYGVDPEYTYDA
jgi:hypothetical protein